MELKDTINEMISEDYKERFIAEYKQLSIRIQKLEDLLFKINTNQTPSCFKPSCPLSLLEDQLLTMVRYHGVLKIRARYENINLEEVEI